MRCIVIAEKEAAEHRELDFHFMIAANNKVSSKPRTDHQVAPSNFLRGADQTLICQQVWAVHHWPTVILLSLLPLR